MLCIDFREPMVQERETVAIETEVFETLRAREEKAPASGLECLCVPFPFWVACGPLTWAAEILTLSLNSGVHVGFPF